MLKVLCMGCDNNTYPHAETLIILLVILVKENPALSCNTQKVFLSIVVRASFACTPGWTSKMSRIKLLTWVRKQCSCVVIVSLYSKGAWKKILWRTRLFCICIKLFKLICNFFKNWLYVKYRLLNLYVAVNYFEGQLVFLTRGNPKCVWSLDGREASSAECPLLPPPSSDILWGSFLALDGHLLG